MMNMDVSEVKACLRALLSSSAFSYTLRPLLNDFKHMTGFDLPLFGCKNPVEFLKTLTDTVQLIGDFYNPIVALVESQKSSHITSLVERQRNKKFDTGNQYGRYMPRRLILSSVQECANNSRNTYNVQGNYLSYGQNNFPRMTEQRQGVPNSMSYGNCNSFWKYEDQRKNYINPPARVQNYPKCQPPRLSTNMKKNENQNQTLVVQPLFKIESQNNSKDLQNEFTEFLEPPPTISQPRNICNVLNTSQSNLQETGKTDSCYFEDFSDIDSSNTENCKSPVLKTNSTFSYINDGMKTKLRDLIKKYPDGLWCCELPSSFLQEFNVVLDYREFGCTSLIEMLSELPDVFRCIRPGNEDWILFDASVPPSDKEKKMMKLQENGNIASEVANNVHKLLLKHCENSTDVGVKLTEIPYLYQVMFDTPLDFQSLGFSSLKSLLETYEGSLLNIYEVDKKFMAVPVLKMATHSSVPWKEALPPITKDNDIFKEIFPNDVVGPEGNFPELDLSLHIAVGQRVEVCVAEVWSPGEFCLQLNKFRNRWSRFANDLQNFYNTHLNKYKMPDSTIIPQQICVGLYSEDPENPDEWNRARILKVINERTVMVEFVDFGTVARVKKTQLRFLHKSFQSLPVQAFVAELYKLAPSSGDLWSMKASKKFLELSRVPYLEALLVDIDFKKPQVKVILYDPSHKPHLNINKQLIAENLARSLESKEDLYAPDSEEPKKPKTVNLNNIVSGNNFGAVSDEFSDASDLDCDSYTALFHFKMKSRKAADDRKHTEKVEKPKTEKVMLEFEEVPDWDKIDEKAEAKETLDKEKSEHDLFEVKEDSPSPKQNPDGADSTKPKQNTPPGTSKRPPPGLENVLELNRFRMLQVEQPDEIKKKINILTVELMTTNPSIKNVAVQDPALALKIASEMAEVYIRWMCYDINPFETDSFSRGVMSEPPFMVPLPITPPQADVFPPAVSASTSDVQPEKETNATANASLTEAKVQPPPPSKTTVKKSKYIQLEKIGGKSVHVTCINGNIYFFVEELIRTFSTFTNRDVADRVLHLKKVLIEYKILNKSNGEKILTEVKSFDIPGVFKKKSKKWNVYLIPAESVIKFLQGLGCETKPFENDVISLEKLPKDKGTKMTGAS